VSEPITAPIVVTDEAQTAFDDLDADTLALLAKMAREHAETCWSCEFLSVSEIVVTKDPP